MNKKKKELTYFLDHPNIKRHKSPGNGKSPGMGITNWLEKKKMHTEGKSKSKMDYMKKDKK